MTAMVKLSVTAAGDLAIMEGGTGRKAWEERFRGKTMVITLAKQVSEFFAAARCRFSYDPRRNLYLWFGFLWGLPIPVVTFSLQAHFLSNTTVAAMLTTILSTPLQWFFLIHPLLFAAIFGILGTIRSEKESRITEMVARLENSAIHDPLTGLKNRRYFAHIFHDECARSLRREEALTLLFLDLDHFKKVNDNHGHHLGDLALQATSKYLQQQVRPYDTVVRWGGEEFIILLRATDEEAAIHFSERVRIGIQSELGETLPFSLTISIGLSQYQDNDTLESLTERADRALYHAKQTGRNRVIPWSKVSAESNL
jgi:diguanylate cyclase (GGDEF)-like protein